MHTEGGGCEFEIELIKIINKTFIFISCFNSRIIVGKTKFIYSFVCKVLCEQMFFFVVNNIYFELHWHTKI